MIPLSFASILGGTCTLIGTSTNLVVFGMLKEWTGSDGQATERHTMGLFDLGLFGIPCALSVRMQVQRFRAFVERLVNAY
jgi:di/tricarboxylate transporter